MLEAGEGEREDDFKHSNLGSQNRKHLWRKVYCGEDNVILF